MKRISHFFLILFALMIFCSGYLVHQLISFVQDRSCQVQNELINSGVVCGRPDVIRKTGYLILRKEIEDFISHTSNQPKDVSVYFRDLEHGPIMGINELSSFAPASLLKLPLAFVFLRSAEAQPELLEKKIVYNGTTSVELQDIPPGKSAQPGREYSVAELLELMITYSDNAAYDVLEQFLRAEPHRMQLRTDTFEELGLIDPRDKIEETLTTNRYAGLFRLLYNASYLSPESSGNVLSWLVNAPYQDGLRAGLPQEIKVANKMGERIAPDGSRQLHDCGIVYYPGNPYLLCVMTKGATFEDGQRIISAISRMVYNEIESRKL